MMLYRSGQLLASAVFCRSISVTLRSTGSSLLRTRHGYATQSSIGGLPTTKRKQVTVVNDDGRVKWGALSLGEKVARTTQQTFNFGIILAGLVMTGGVAYILYSDVFASDSKTSHFNRAVDQVKSDPRTIALLGPGKEIKAYGEPTWSKWTRVRPIASTKRKDKDGTEHLLMHFNVEGPLNSGVVNLHMIKGPDSAQYKYKYFALDVKGQTRFYPVNTDEVKGVEKAGLKMFGVKWR